jgi:hypothetical protein
VNQWTSEDGTKTRWYVTLEDGTEAVSFTLVPEGEELEGWALEPPKEEGWKPLLRSPKPAGSPGRPGAPAAYRNTRDGFEREQHSIHASVALQRAIEFTANDAAVKTAELLSLADEFYEWLTRTSGAAPAAATPGGPPAAPAPAPGPPSGGRKKRVDAGAEPASSQAAPAPRCAACGSEQIGFDPKRAVVACLDCGTEWKKD